jgi:hypothetical protein
MLLFPINNKTHTFFSSFSSQPALRIPGQDVDLDGVFIMEKRNSQADGFQNPHHGSKKCSHPIFQAYAQWGDFFLSLQT